MTMIMIDPLNELIAGIDFCMMCTLHPNGQLHTRPMATQAISDDGYLWFFTSAHSSKVDEIRNDHQVNIAYSDPASMRFVSVSGVCELVRSRPIAEQFWRDAYQRWFPRGLDDPELILLKVTVNAVEYWDTQANRMRLLDGGHETVQLRNDRRISTDEREIA